MNFTFKGRYIPALLLTGLLLLSLSFDLERQLEVIKSSSLAAAGIALLILFMRSVSTIIYEDMFFAKRSKFPTTIVLLEQTEYAEHLRRTLTERGYVGMNTREELPTAIRQLTSEYRENPTVRAANIDYSFVRNFSGGIPLLIVAQIAALSVLKNASLIPYFLAGECLYFALSFFFVRVIARKYAEALFTEFLKDTRQKQRPATST